MSFPSNVATNYRTGRNANEFYSYGGVFVPTNTFVRIDTLPDSFFLCKKVHLLNYVNVSATTSPGTAQLKIVDTKQGRSFQSRRIALNTVGGNVHSPNVLPAPILFSPLTTILLDFAAVQTRVYVALEGEKVYDPDPAWVKKMQSRFWYQFAEVDEDSNTTEVVTLDLKDPNYDFAVFRLLSRNSLDAVLSNANPGFIQIRDKGPQGQAWSNVEVMTPGFCGAFGNGAGPRIVQPPMIIPGTSQIEMIKRSVPSSSYIDFVFDGVKFPRGTNLEDWL